MFRIAVLIVVLAAASAFMPAHTKLARNHALTMKFEEETGALPPLGFWDPLGFTRDIDQGTFNQRRAAELKHGRIAMLGVVGYIVAEFARFPGSIDLDGTTFQSIPNGVAALKAIQPLTWFQITAIIGYMEVFGWKQVENSSAGDFGLTFFGRRLEGEEKKEQQTKELQNGRLAMLSMVELLTHDVTRPMGEALLRLPHL